MSIYIYIFKSNSVFIVVAVVFVLLGNIKDKQHYNGKIAGAFFYRNIMLLKYSPVKMQFCGHYMHNGKKSASHITVFSCSLCEFYFFCSFFFFFTLR